MKKRFSDSDVKKIVESAMVYQCACPAQVAELLLELRRVEAYESGCLEKANDHLSKTHIAIRDAVADVHERMENCLDEVLEIEGWDRNTMEMPENLRSQQD